MVVGWRGNSSGRPKARHPDENRDLSLAAAPRFFGFSGRGLLNEVPIFIGMTIHAEPSSVRIVTWKPRAAPSHFPRHTRYGDSPIRPTPRAETQFVSPHARKLEWLCALSRLALERP
jgi:hypothetical protein